MKLRAWIHMVVTLGLLLSPWAGGLRLGKAVEAAPAAETWYVKPGWAGACTSWADACELQAALGMAGAGDEIWVAAGTYLPDYDPGSETHTGDRMTSFQLVSGVAVYGGFPDAGEPGFGDREWETYVTTLSGDIGTPSDSSDNSYHVVASSGVTETAVLDGFTISGGSASGGTSPLWDGAGMYNTNSSPTLRNLIFSGNHARWGGGLYNYNGSSPALANVRFSDNSAEESGGGMINNGSNPTLTNVMFSGNSATYGGGMDNTYDSHPALSNVVFAHNTANWGGGMSNGQSGPVLVNVSFGDNTAGNQGGGIYNWQSGAVLANCILWGNAAAAGPQIYDNSSTTTVSYSLVQAGWSGTGNLDVDPLFADAGSGDLHLRLDSPAVDAGDNSAVPADVTTDLDGNSRIGNGRVDMGAYEFQYPEPSSPIYVDVAATGARDGSDWPSALTSLRFALAWAGVGAADYGLPGVEIWVAEGTYKPTVGADREATFQLHRGVAVYGGFTGTETSREQRNPDPATNNTVLSGDLLANDGPSFSNYEDNVYHVVTGSSIAFNAVLDGLTISGGNATSPQGGIKDTRGGGMYSDHGRSALANLIFSGNRAWQGGGMYDYNTFRELTRVIFSNNDADEGGGLYLGQSWPTLTDVTFSENSAGKGGGMYNGYTLVYPPATLINAAFRNNSATRGGGIYNWSNGNLALTGVTFSGNTATENGGGIYNGYQSNLELWDTALSGNTAANGGGIYNESSDITGHDLPGTVTSNSATNGGGIYNTGNSTVDNIAVIDNTAASGGGVYNDGGAPALTYLSVLSNTATYGGGMFNSQCNSTLDSVEFSGNAAATSGGGVYNDNSSPSLSNVTFSGNTAGGGDGSGGGGVYNDNSSPSLSHVTFSGNTAFSGGGMRNENSSPTLANVILSGNTAEGGDGGGMHNYPDSSPALTNVTFANNRASRDGAGMYNHTNSNPTLTATAFISNTAGSDGGGMYNHDNSSPALTYVTFTGNSSYYFGGGMANRDNSNPLLTNVTFIGNRADSDGDSNGNGGGIYNEESSPVLTNVTLSANSAQYGGGLANAAGTTPSLPALENTIVWGNTAVIASASQIYDDGSSSAVGSACMVEDGYSGCFVEDTTSPFADADGPDNVAGTVDDDLRLVGTSNAIDAGDTAHLPEDRDDLDADGNTTEKLPYDLGGEPRCYGDGDLDGVIDGEPDPCSYNYVDLGAYEAGCHPWHMHYAGRWLAEGQKYRLGFHHEIDEPSTVTVSDTLESYAAERAAGNLTKARDAYAYALDCAATVTQTNQALAGLLEVTWEQATGAMLEGNEQMVTALDLTDAGGMTLEISALETAIDKYAEATQGYLLPLTGEHQSEFLAAMGISRTEQITYTETITQVDVQRLAAASAKKSRAKLELAERQFRSGDRGAAEETLRQGKAEGTVELALLEEIWDGVVEDVHYHDLLRNLSDMDRLLGFLVAGKNPLGYSPEWIPIHYRPGLDENNYLRVDELAKEKLGEGDNSGAQDAIEIAAAESQRVHDEYAVMQERYNTIKEKYDDELELLCGTDAGEPDLDRCDGGTIEGQISAVEQAQLRLGRVLEQMNVLNRRVQIEVEARARAAGIYEATAELINPDTSEKYSSLVEQEEQISAGWKAVKGVAGVLIGMTTGGRAGSAFGPKGAILGGLFGGLGPGLDMIAGLLGPKQGPPKEERLLEFQAWQNAQMVICDGQIADVEFEKRIKELFLEYGLLDIDYAIALENLHQELLRLDGMKTRVEYLLAEKAEAMAFTSLLYRDPGHRVLRDQYMEAAQDSYDTALDYTFRAGRALEYEANLTGVEFAPGHVPPDPDGMFGIRNIVTLIQARANTKTAYDDWSADKTPHTYVTDDPYPKILLSRALNYEDADLPGIGFVTAEEQFNAYVIRNPANRYDLDEDGIAESLYFTFDTSVVKGNPFFDHCLFNDQIESVKMRIRGADLGQTSVTVRLGWGDTRCQNTDCGTTFLRSEEAFMTGDGFGNWLDDLRAYKVQPKLASIQAVTGDVPFPPGADNYDLATRSVANPNWTLFIDGTLPANQGLNLDNVDEIELILTHQAYSLQAPMCQGPGTKRLAPSRPYQPMERVLDPESFPVWAAQGLDVSLSVEEGATSLNGLYAGTVAITSPQYLPSLDANLVLMATGSSLSGYLDPTQSLHIPVVDESTGQGPAVSGSWSEEGFSLQSEVFTTTLGAGLPIRRQVIVHSGVISESGEILTGVYSETLAGLTPEPMVIQGSVALFRLPVAIQPSASFGAFPVSGPPPVIVQFTDLSGNAPTSWAWDFGDGGSSTEQHPAHIFTAPGTYTVTLTVTNAQGSDTEVKPSYVSVTAPAAPEAYFSASPRSGAVPLTVAFEDGSAGGPTGWLWDFGDGGTSTVRHPEHTYTAAGSYTVTLTVSNALGSDTRTVPDYIAVEGERIYLPVVMRKAP